MPHSPSPELACRVYAAAFPNYQTLSEHLTETLGLAAGLAELVDDHADWAAFHGEDFPAAEIQIAARSIQRFIAIGCALAHGLAEEQSRISRQLATEREMAL